MAARWDVIGCFYGINAESFEVERVVRRLGGRLYLSRPDVVEVRFLSDEKVGVVELRYLFGLSDVAYVSAVCMGTEYERQVKAKLRRLAEFYHREAA